MNLAYLINRYPAVSHSFIRREILALEEMGLSISRFSIRPTDGELADPQDIAEAGRTRSILAAGGVAALPWRPYWQRLPAPADS